MLSFGNLKTKPKLLAALVVVGLVALAFQVIPVAAQSNGLGVTPKLSYTVQAGSQVSDTLYVDNLNKTQALNLHVSVVDFTSQDQSGTPKLLQAANEPLTPWSLKPYITMPDYVTIAAGQSKLIPLTVKFPANLGAGTYYSAVEYAAVTGNGSQQVNVAASSATLLFVSVPGDASELLTLQKFGATDKNQAFKSLFTSSPEYFAYTLKNNGNVAESPAGSLVIKNIFGKISAHIDNVNPKSQLALLGQTRKFDFCSPKNTDAQSLAKDTNCTPLKLFPGRYSAQLAILYGQNGQPTRQIGASSSFWYLPAWFLVVVVIILLAIAWLVYKIHTRLSGRHR